MSAEPEGEMFSMQGNILDSFSQVESTLPEVWEDWPYSLRTTSAPSEDTE